MKTTRGSNQVSFKQRSHYVKQTIIMAIKLLLLLLVASLSLVASSSAEEAQQAEAGECLTCDAAVIWDNECSLYMAPSTIEGAGYGIYTTKEIGVGELVGKPDVIIPIYDKFKTFTVSWSTAVSLLAGIRVAHGTRLLLQYHPSILSHDSKGHVQGGSGLECCHVPQV